MEADRAEVRIQLVVITVLGAGVRLTGLGYHELWLDEILRVLWAIEPETNLWEQATVGHAGSVFTTLWSGFVWHTSHSFTALRLLQALCSIACIPLSFLLARRLLGAGASVGVAALVALSPMQVAIARQAEEYAFLVLFFLVATLLLTRIVEARKVSGRDAALAGLISAAGFLSGGYMILPGLLSLALAMLWLLRRDLGKRDFAVLALSQAPMVAFFFYSLTFWAFDPRPVVTEYLAFMRGWVQFGSPRLPTSVLADLFFYGQFWGWGGELGPWVYSVEALVALGLLAIIWRGHRALAKQSMFGALPGLVVVMLFAINAVIFLNYSGIPVYYSRIYAGATFLLFILLIAGLGQSLREVRQLAVPALCALMLTSTLAIKLEIHPARPLWFRPAMKNLSALTDTGEIWVHPGELADLLRLETRDSDLAFTGVWHDSFATAEATVTLDDPISGELVAEWAGHIASSEDCLLVIPYFIDFRDSGRTLDLRLREKHGYALAPGAGSIPLYCPGEGAP